MNRPRPTDRACRVRWAAAAALGGALSIAASPAAMAQARDSRGVGVANQQAAGPAAAAKTPKAAAPVDLTGYWVAIVTEDWRFRMVTAPKGDYPDVPLNDAGKNVADGWDPANDEQGDRCKAYGAPNIMRVPSRFHITWADDSTLKIESDAGRQTRLFHFNMPAAAGVASRQGYSAAAWEGRASLKVFTSRLSPGYLQSNGVPYSGRAELTEYFDIVKEPNGDQWLVDTAIVADPTYLTRTFKRSTHFRKQADAAGWDPSPCVVK
jgi:hypothetical protein